MTPEPLEMAEMRPGAEAQRWIASRASWMLSMQQAMTRGCLVGCIGSFFAAIY